MHTLRHGSAQPLCAGSFGTAGLSIQKDVSADGADVSVKAESTDLRLNVPERAAGVDYEDVSCALRFFQRGTRAFGNDVVRCHDRPVHIKKEDLSIHISIITRRQFATKPPKCKD